MTSRKIPGHDATPRFATTILAVLVASCGAGCSVGEIGGAAPSATQPTVTLATLPGSTGSFRGRTRFTIDTDEPQRVAGHLMLDGRRITFRAGVGKHGLLGVHYEEAGGAAIVVFRDAKGVTHVRWNGHMIDVPRDASYAFPSLAGLSPGLHAALGLIPLHVACARSALPAGAAELMAMPFHLAQGARPGALAASDLVDGVQCKDALPGATAARKLSPLAQSELLVRAKLVAMAPVARLGGGS